MTQPSSNDSQLQSSSSPTNEEQLSNIDDRTVPSWFLSFSAAMVPFCAFCYGHSRGVTTRVVDRVVKSPVGVYGLLALPFLTLGMEKSIYDTVQAWQGINPNVRPADRGGFPSGGAGKLSNCISYVIYVLFYIHNSYVSIIHMNLLHSATII